MLKIKVSKQLEKMKADARKEGVLYFFVPTRRNPNKLEVYVDNGDDFVKMSDTVGIADVPVLQQMLKEQFAL